MNPKHIMYAKLLHSRVPIKFELSHVEYVHFRYARGLITREEVQAELSRPMDISTTRRMEELALQLVWISINEENE